MDPTDNRLLQHLDQLRKRVNTEAGIPMFLACEDIALGVLNTSMSSALPELNREIVSRFRLDVELVQRYLPDAPITDVAKIIERLAEQDFALGGAAQDS